MSDWGTRPPTWWGPGCGWRSSVATQQAPALWPSSGPTGPSRRPTGDGASGSPFSTIWRGKKRRPVPAWLPSLPRPTPKVTRVCSTRLARTRWARPVPSTAPPTAFLRALVERPVSAGRAKPVKGLAEQLTDREYMVLVHLPSRQSNAEIAERLGVSLNTVKTHLKHIYRKLDVVGRSDAVDAAERLHLL